MNTLDSHINAVAKQMKRGLPDGFRRRGRKWVRTIDGLHHEVWLRRLRFSYDLDAAMLRLAVAYGVEGGELVGGDTWFSSWPDWRVDADMNSDQIERIADEVVRDLAGISAFFESIATQDQYLERASASGSPLGVLRLLVELNRSEDAAQLLKSGSITPSGDSRQEQLACAQTVLEAHRLAHLDLSAEWLEFAARSLKPFRGRPPKRHRAQFEAVRDVVETHGTSST